MTDESSGSPLARMPLYPNWTILVCGTGAAAFAAFAFLPGPVAIAATLLGALMITGADIDRRLFLLPDVVTYGATATGIGFAPLLEMSSRADVWSAVVQAALRAVGLALLIGLLRVAHRHLRGREGLGFGDVKLAAAVGAWLPLEAIPYCFGLAASAGLIAAALSRPKTPTADIKLPLGAFLCPALWLVFFIQRVLSLHHIV
jgi:leader peptidase (prepilin peptidase) / N-methyltransferase